MSMGSHQSANSNTDTWFTPPALIEAVGGADSFDLDPCSHVARPWATARRHYTREDNALLKGWFGRVWLNPPYSIALITAFLARMAHHNCGIALTFARTETDPFCKYVWGAATGLLFLRGRLNFHYQDGRRAKANAGAPSVMISYGSRDRDILAAAPIDGSFVPLRLEASVVGCLLPQTWAEALAVFFHGQSGPVSLGELYRAFARHPKTRTNRHFKAKIRQALQRGDYECVERGVWRVAT